jgi:hypothetical protein
LGVALWACADDQTAGTSEESEGIVAIKDREIAGVTQKGPFLTGASVTIQELDGLTLVQTGKSFRGKVVNDNGEFSVENMNLKSPYVLLEVNGYFRNEITGRNSDGPVFMKAIAEVGEHSLVNINLLTHLEYERVQKLIEQNKSIPEAKLIADREIFSAFYGDALDPKNYEKMENLNIFGKSENDAALLHLCFFVFLEYGLCVLNC